MQTLDIRLIAFDLDGTALNRQKELSPRTLTALQNAIKAGKIIVSATGRSLNSIPAELMELQGLPYLILNNGSAVVSLPEKNVVVSHVFEREISLSLIEQFKAFHCMILASKPEHGTLDQSIHGINDEKMKNVFIRIKKFWNPLVFDIEKTIRENSPWVNHFSLVFTDEDKWLRVFETLKNQEGLNITSAAWGCIDIMPPGINKGKALRFVAEKLGIEMSKVMAIGDNLNDMEMLRDSGYSVAMDNGVDALKNLADRITLSCDEDGAAIAIEEIL